MEINVTPRFIKSYKKLHKIIQEKAKVKEAVFRKNPFDKRLKTHKLLGKEKESWAFWVDYSYRFGFVPQPNRQSSFLGCLIGLIK